MLKMIVLATNNKNKVFEFQEILKDYEIELKCIADFGPLPEAVENGDTFDENAYKKALTPDWLSRLLMGSLGCFQQDMPVKMPPMKKIA